MNNGKVYELISCDKQVSQCKNFTDKDYSTSRGTKTYTMTKKKKENGHFDPPDSLCSTVIS